MDYRNPKVSVVLPCRNEANCIASCLQSALSQEQPGGGFEVIVADGFSTDATRELLQKFAGRDRRVRVIDNRQQIVSTGLNAAIRAAHGDIIIRLDAHTDYASDYVCQCVKTLEKTGADNVGGPARTKARTYLEKVIAASYHSPFGVGGARFHDPEYEGWVDTVTYGCWHRHSFEKFGYFDEELVRNQDDEHNLRIIRGGGKIWQNPAIKSWYRPRGSLVALFTQYMQYGYWKVRVIQKHKLPASWRHLIPASFVLALFLGVVLSTLYPPPGGFGDLAGALLSFVLGAYLTALLVASLHAASHSEWKLLPLLPLAFYCYHFGYGYGFSRGIWDFVIRRKTPGSWSRQLTRPSRAAPSSQESPG